MTAVKAVIMDETGIRRALMRISHEIIEKNNGCDDLCLVGIRRRGVPIAQMLSDNICAIEGKRPLTGEADISLYRDDLTKISDMPVVNKTCIPFSVDGKKIVLVDDVIYTGRTVRAAIDVLFKLGRPAAIRLAVLIDRGHRELPIRADFVGKNIPTAQSETVAVMLPPYDGDTRVEIRSNL